MNEKLSAIISKMFNIATIHEGLSPENVEGWDSFSHIELILEIEKTFAISISASEAVRLDSVGKIASYLESKGVS